MGYHPNIHSVPFNSISTNSCIIANGWWEIILKACWPASSEFTSVYSRIAVLGELANVGGEVIVKFVSTLGGLRSFGWFHSLTALKYTLALYYHVAQKFYMEFKLILWCYSLWQNHKIKICKLNENVHIAITSSTKLGFLKN